MKREASAQWQGALKKGKGTLSTKSKTLNETPYSFTDRFEGNGTNPEELIAAAHAGCFTMALCAILGKEGYTPTALNTKAELSLEQVEGNWTVTNIDLAVEAEISDIEEQKFEQIAEQAKKDCPISKLLKTNIGLQVTLIR
ncbi:MAG TPA: OsmC family protein [Gammaproteobacteria bacterium]|nr:OsmC family protein [Gammaproteobacteria bacterium]